MKYYHSIETGEVVSLARVREEFDRFQLDGEYIGESFDYYLEGCMYWNNGDLIPLAEYSNRLKSRLRKVLSFIRNESDREYYEDEIESLTAEITELEKYKGE